MHSGKSEGHDDLAAGGLVIQLASGQERDQAMARASKSRRRSELALRWGSASESCRVAMVVDGLATHAMTIRGSTCANDNRAPIAYRIARVRPLLMVTALLLGIALLAF